MSQSLLFDDYERTDASAAGELESVSRFLDRSAAAPFARTRVLLEAWFGRFPHEHRADLRARLRRDDDDTFASAFWELYLHEVLAASGWEVEVHPQVSGKSTRPDFLAQGPDGRVYVEARIVPMRTAEAVDLQRRKVVIDTLRRTRSPDFWLSVTIWASAPTDPPMGAKRAELERWLDALDVAAEEDVVATTGEYRSFPIEVADWQIEIEAVPRAADDRGRLDLDPLGSFGPGQGESPDDLSPLQRALKKKGSRYGDLDAPYLIGFLVLRDFLDDFDVDASLFGRRCVEHGVRHSPSDNIQPARRRRMNDGYFRDIDGFKHVGVSGIAVAKHLTPWRVAQVVPEVWAHPGARLPLPDGLPFALVEHDLIRGKVATLPPPSPPHEVLGIAASWPGFPARRRPA